MTSKQSQKAGPQSTQTQIGTVIVNGIDEKRVREVVNELLPLAIKEFSLEATATANQRGQEFNKKLIQRMVQEQALAAFSDPSFQILLLEAQKSAASTEREPDYDLLAELMVHRFKKGENRIARAGIVRAVEIVNQISDEALLGLTVFHSGSYFFPVSGDLVEGLKALDNLFSKVIYAELPRGAVWLDHLDILDAVRISSLGGTKLLEDYWYDKFEGYFVNGIKENSETFEQAAKLLTEAKLPLTSLSKNAYNGEYVKLSVLGKGRIGSLKLTNSLGLSRELTSEEIIALEKVYELYDGTKMSKQDFITELEKHANLSRLREWWNTLSEHSIQITSVGKVVAHSNAQRVDQSLPALD